MRRFLLVSFLTLLYFGCTGTKAVKDTASTPEKMELGWIQRSDFVTPSYPKFQENYDTVHIRNEFVDMIKLLHEGVDIVVVIGTWCGDSKREVPRFLKIADLASMPAERVRFYGVNRMKKSADGVTDRYNISLVPTFIFFKNNKEIGRIVESSRNSLEEDILNILAEAGAQ